MGIACWPKLIDRYPSLRQHLARCTAGRGVAGRALAQHFHHEPLGRRHLLFDEGRRPMTYCFPESCPTPASWSWRWRTV
ncbi:hypothetical protein ACPA9J_27285 [Pseudomonas aeruginosa]